MKKIYEAEVIYNAFMDTLMAKLPKNKKDYPDWYRERLEKCGNCKYNTKNIPKKYLPIDMYIPEMLGKHRCSICTCFLKQKCWSKTEMCAIGETEARPSYLPEGYITQGGPETPRWNRIELLTLRSDMFNIRGIDPNYMNVDLTKEGDAFLFQLMPLDIGNDVHFDFILETKDPIFIWETNATCGCTATALDYIDEHNIKVHVDINTKGFGAGAFSKRFRFKYSLKDESGDPIQDEDKREVIEFLIKGHMSGIKEPDAPVNTESDGQQGEGNPEAKEG